MGFLLPLVVEMTTELREEGDGRAGRWDFSVDDSFEMTTVFEGDFSPHTGRALPLVVEMTEGFGME